MRERSTRCRRSVRYSRIAIICGTLGQVERYAKPHLFNLEMVGAQGLLDLLVGPARRRLHRAAEPVEHPFESELLHRDNRSAGPLSLGPLAPAAATSQPSAADTEPVLAEGRSVSPALLAPLLRRAARAAADADTRPPRRRSTKTRRGTASGMYGNAAPPEDRYRARGRAVQHTRTRDARATTPHTTPPAATAPSALRSRSLAASGCPLPLRESATRTIDLHRLAHKRDEHILRMKARLAEEKFHS